MIAKELNMGTLVLEEHDLIKTLAKRYAETTISLPLKYVKTIIMFQAMAALTVKMNSDTHVQTLTKQTTQTYVFQSAEMLMWYHYMRFVMTESWEMA